MFVFLRVYQLICDIPQESNHHDCHNITKHNMVLINYAYFDYKTRVRNNRSIQGHSLHVTTIQLFLSINKIYKKNHNYGEKC